MTNPDSKGKKTSSGDSKAKLTTAQRIENLEKAILKAVKQLDDHVKTPDAHNPGTMVKGEK